MPDEIKQDEVVEEPESKQPEPQDKKASFTQDEVNRLIVKEKASWKRTHDKLLADKDAEIESVQTNQKEAEKIVAEQVKTLKTDLNIDEDEWEATMADRDVFVQYMYLAKKVEKAGKKHVTETPKGEKSVGVTFERINKI